MIDAQNCTCVDFYSLRGWNARGFKVRKGSTMCRRGLEGPEFCACQVVARLGKRGEGSLAWVDDPTVHHERSGGYMRPWYEASETRDRS